MWANDVFIVSQGYYQALFDERGKPVTGFRQGVFMRGLDEKLLFIDTRNYNSSELIDKQGKLIVQIPSKIVFVDSVNQRYRECYPGNNCAIYDKDGNRLLYRTNEDREFQYGLVRTSKNEPPYLQGVIDTLGNVLAEQRYDRVVIGSSMFAGIVHDTAYVFNRKGKQLFSCFAHEVMMMHNKLVGVRLFGSWALKDSMGRTLTPFQYYQLKDIYQTGFIEAGNTVIDARGVEVIKGDHSDVKDLGGGWRLFDSYGLYSQDIIKDAQFNTLFKDEAYLKVHPIGPRYLAFSRKYSDPDPRIYDRDKKRFVNINLDSYLGGDAYLVDNGDWKQIVKNGSVLDLPAFNKLDRLDDNRNTMKALYVFSKVQEQQRRGRYEILPCAACERDVFGLIDTQANVILPMRYASIEKLTEYLIYAIDTSGTQGVLSVR